jgi:hypothetical protein
LHQKELLTNAIWSLYVQEPDRIATCKEINNIGVSIEQANQFIDQHQCIPDAANIHFYPEGSSHYGGIPYAETMYSDVKFRIISETRFKSDKNNFPWVTEKTWLTIVNRCPFIMVGEPGTLDYLESMGFKTFKNYLKIHDYDNIRPIGNRLDAIVTNTEYWLNDADFADEIQLDVEHNYNRFIELGKEIETNVLQQIHDNKLQAQLDDIVSTDDPLAKK